MITANTQSNRYNSSVIDRYRNYQPRYTRQPKKKSRKGLFVLACGVAVFIGGKTVLSKIQSSPEKSTAASSVPKPTKKITAEPIATSTWNTLNQQVSAILNENPSLDISVAVIDLVSNTKANYGIQDNFAGASTTKVLTATAYLHESESGGESLTKKLGSMTAKEHIKQMINRSNNDSWALLNRELTHTKLEDYAHELGMSSYNAKENTITASDEALLLQKLYSGKLLNDANTKLLLSYMQRTNNEDMIPVVAPEGADLYHKYGQLEDRLHDAAIIDYNGRPIVLVVYTKGGASDGSNYSSRTRLVQQLASAVFDTIYAQ